MKRTEKQIRAEYDKLCRKLAEPGWLSHGYVQNRGPGAGGPCYQWTRKERGKTVSVALSKEQYEWMKKAIANWKKTQEALLRMEQLSRTLMFQTIPGTTRRKPLSNKVMGTI